MAGPQNNHGNATVGTFVNQPIRNKCELSMNESYISTMECLPFVPGHTLSCCLTVQLAPSYAWSVFR